MSAEAGADVILDVEFDSGVLFLVVRNIGDAPATTVQCKFEQRFFGLGGTTDMSGASALPQDRVPCARARDPDAPRHERGLLRPQGAGEAGGDGDVARRRRRAARSGGSSTTSRSTAGSPTGRRRRARRFRPRRGDDGRSGRVPAPLGAGVGPTLFPPSSRIERSGSDPSAASGDRLCAKTVPIWRTDSWRFCAEKVPIRRKAVPSAVAVPLSRRRTRDECPRGPRRSRPAWRRRARRPTRAALSSTCSGRLAPTIADATFGSRSTHASASCAIVMPEPVRDRPQPLDRARAPRPSGSGPSPSPSRPTPRASPAGGASPAGTCRSARPGASGDHTICQMPFAAQSGMTSSSGLAPEHRVLRLARHELLDAGQVERGLDLLGRPLAEADVARLARRGRPR